MSAPGRRNVVPLLLLAGLSWAPPAVAQHPFITTRPAEATLLVGLDSATTDWDLDLERLTEEIQSRLVRAGTRIHRTPPGEGPVIRVTIRLRPLRRPVGADTPVGYQIELAVSEWAILARKANYEMLVDTWVRSSAGVTTEPSRLPEIVHRQVLGLVAAFNGELVSPAPVKGT